MKKLILFLSLLPLPTFGQGLLRSNVTLYWNYPVSELTNISFYVKGSPDVMVPFNEWTTKAVVPGVPDAPTPTNVTITLAPQAFYFVCQASNFWGLSDPSNVASTPPPPRSDVSMGVR